MFLNLEKITQVAFAEYHSKRNFVERVHAAENEVLSKHGPFSSNALHPRVTVGSKEHRENMEDMAQAIQGCICSGSFGKEQLLCYRGIKMEDYLFRNMTTFLSLSEDAKQEYTPTYKVQQNRLLQDLHSTWETPLEFTGTYLKDHLLIHNGLLKDKVTCWRDKYTTVLYSPEVEVACNRYELQPLPDYIRWIKTGELHYLPLEETSNLAHGRSWTDISGAFLPTKILDLFFNIVHDPSEDIIKQVALLGWIPPHEVKDYQKKKINEQLQSQLDSELEKERWKEESLYKENTKPQLDVMCRQLGIPVTPALLKHQLCSLIYQKQNKEEPPLSCTTLYSGNILSVPHTISGIGRLTVAKLKAILRAHKLPYLGSKDELVLRVLMLRQGRRSEASLKQRNAMVDLINVAKDLIMAEQLMNLTNHIYRTKKYATYTSKTFVPMPSHIRGEEDLLNLYSPLQDYLQELSCAHSTTQELIRSSKSTSANSSEESILKEQVIQIGAIISVRWSTSEVGDSGWKPGWYKAEVHGYCEETDILTLRYLLEPDDTYEEEISPLLLQKKVKLLSTPL